MADPDVMGELAAVDNLPPDLLIPPPYRYPGQGTEPVEGMVGGAKAFMGSLASIPQRVMQNAEQSRVEGAYDPSATAEALSFMLPVGAARGGVGELGATGGRMVQPAAKFAQYAEQYPPVGPPVTAYDKVKKTSYLAKELTPEAIAFQKERTRVANDMAQNGYQPYFDVAKRYDANPAYYPPNVDTTSIIPAKQATIDKHMNVIGGDAARARLQDAYQRGAALLDTDRWYQMGQLEKEFIKELGPKAGRQAFQDRIATSMAATTGGADPQTNWLMAHYGNYLRANKLPYPQASYDLPFPIGGRYAAGNMAMHQKVFDAGGFPALGAENPKRHNFAQDFTGNTNAATMDEQMVSGMTPGVNVPPAGTYGLYQRVLNEEAAKAGVPPRQFQEVGWAGFKNAKTPDYNRGQPFIGTINDSIERTRRLTGMPRDEILRRGVIRSEIPMYGVVGAAGMGALADQSRYGAE